MIKAKGVRSGSQLEVIYTDDKKFLFNGEPNSALQYGLEYELAMCYAVGGTYFPNRDSLLNVYNVLQNYYFDYNAEIETDEVIPHIEHVEGRIY